MNDMKAELFFMVTQLVIVTMMIAGLVCSTSILAIAQTITSLALIAGGFGTLWLVITLVGIAKIKRIKAQRDYYPQITVTGQYDYLDKPKRKLLSWKK